MPQIPKSVYRRALHNPNAIVAPNYSVVEDIAQTPCSMSTLEVLQNFPSQQNAFISALGYLDSSNAHIVKFDVFEVKARLLYHVDFQINVVHATKTIGRTVVREGELNC